MCLGAAPPVGQSNDGMPRLTFRPSPGMPCCWIRSRILCSAARKTGPGQGFCFNHSAPLQWGAGAPPPDPPNHPTTTPLPLKGWAKIFSGRFGRLKILSGAFGANSCGPKILFAFGASKSSTPPGAGGAGLDPSPPP